MRFARGHSGLTVSEITCGNWLTHGPVTVDVSTACVHAALDAGITTFDTALTDPERGDLVERSPAKTAKPFDVMPAWQHGK